MLIITDNLLKTRSYLRIGFRVRQQAFIGFWVRGLGLDLRLYLWLGSTVSPLCVENHTQVQMNPWMLAEATPVTEFEYYFACTCNGVHLYFIISPGKMIFALLEL